MNKVFVLFVFFAFSFINTGISQCLFEVDSNGFEYSVSVDLEVTDVIYTQAGSTCNVQIEVTYDVQIDIPNQPGWWNESLYVIQGNLDCAGSSGLSFFDLPNAGGSGKVLSETFSFSNENCEDVSLDCPIIISVQGPELNTSSTCHVFNSSSLPITLERFDYRNSDNNIDLQWNTYTEINFSHFELQESYNLSEWNKIAIIDGSNSISGANYNYEIPHKNRDRYIRLKMVDLDTYTDYSDILAIKSSLSNKMSVYPNPSSDRIQISNTSSKVAMIYNSMGKLSILNIDDKNTVDILSISPGYYIIQTIEENGNTQSTSFVKN